MLINVDHASECWSMLFNVDPTIEQHWSRVNNIDQHLQCVINIDQPSNNFDQLWLTLINQKCLQCIGIWALTYPESVVIKNIRGH